MLLKQLPTSKVDIHKQNGQMFLDITAHVQPELIIIEETSVPIEEGDIVSRKLNNGLIERYIILEASFYEKMHGISEHYQLKVEKTTKLPVKTEKQTVINNNYSAEGNNARINIESKDSSTNITNTQHPIVFSDLRSAIKAEVNSEIEKRELLNKITEMESSVGEKDTFLEKYQEFMSLSANHMTVLAPFIPALSGFLS